MQRKKRRTSGMIIWMGYSEDRSGSHDFSGGGRRGCQDLIWGLPADRVPVRLLVTCLPWGALRSSLRMCRPIDDLLGPFTGRAWVGSCCGCGTRRTAQGAGAGAGESRAVECRTHVTGGEANRQVLSKWGMRRAEA